MAEEKKIKFSAEGSELTAFMKKLQSDSKTMYESFANEAAKQTKNQKEQFKIIEDQLKASREFLKVQKEITQEKLKQAKSIVSGLGDSFEDRAERVAAERKIQRLQNELNGIKGEEKSIRGAQDFNKSNGPKEEKNIFSEVLKAGFLRDIAGLLKNSVNSETGLDIVSPFAQITGGLAGGLVGTGMDALAGTKILGTGAGQTNFSAIGMQFGKDLSGMAADAVVRHFRTLDKFQQATFGFNAIGGRGEGVNMANSGFDSIAVKEAMSRISLASGSTNNASGNAAMVLGLQRGFGVGEDATLSAFGMERSGGGSAKINVQRALGVGIAEGLDRSRFSDAIKTQTQLLQKFSETKENVSGSDATRLMYEFNRIGGMFSIGDPRSLSNIDKINSGLSNPQTPFSQAMSYSVLRSLKPNADMWELQKMQEQGIQTPGYLQEMMKMIRSSSASESYQKFIAKSEFNLPSEAIDRLFAQGDKIGSMSPSEIQKLIPDNVIKSESEKYTSTQQKDAARVTDAFIDGFMEGIIELESQFEKRFSQAIDKAAEHFREKFKFPDLTSSDDKTVIKHNAVGSKKPLEKGKDRYYNKDGSSVDYVPTAGTSPKTYYH